MGDVKIRQYGVVEKRDPPAGEGLEVHQYGVVEPKDAKTLPAGRYMTKVIRPATDEDEPAADQAGEVMPTAGVKVRPHVPPAD